MKSEAYTSSDDSRLLRDALRGYSGGRFLEIGAGNGGTLIGVRDRFELVVGTDLAKPAMNDWTEKGISFVLVDSASCLASSSFDLVAFNPPYLKGKVEDRAVDGGEELEVPLRFLEDAIRVVNETGRILMLLNDDADTASLKEACKRAGFTLQRIASQRMFFEELSVFEAQRMKSRV